MYPNDVVVLQLSQELRFLNQLPDEVLIGPKARVQTLQGYPRAEAAVPSPLREEDLCHSPLPDLLEESKLTLDAEPLCHRPA